MCGRYRLSRRKQLIEEYFETETESEVDWEPRYRGCYETRAGIQQDSRRKLEAMRRCACVCEGI